MLLVLSHLLAEDERPLLLLFHPKKLDAGRVAGLMLRAKGRRGLFCYCCLVLVIVLLRMTDYRVADEDDN